MTLNKETILKEADVFGLAWLSDGATVARMPLTNVLAMCADISPTTVAVTDCSEHISQGGGEGCFIYCLHGGGLGGEV
jgi:hypothetical protein